MVMPETLADSTDSALALVQRTSLTRLMADAVENLILTGEMSPGTKLNEAAIAERFGVSRGPLREALRMLEESGLIRQEKNRGAFVREIDLDEAAEIYDVRAGLDATAGRLLAPRITPEQVAALRALADEMQEVAGRNDVDRFHRLNLAFHDRLIGFADNRSLSEIYQRLVKQLALFRRRNLLVPQAIPLFADEHSAIVDCLAAGDATASGEALYRHAQGGKARMQQQRPIG
jgi:phosphonate utilization transcriptional regulator